MRLGPPTGDVPLPRPTPVSRPYWDGALAGQLRYQRCGDCGTAQFGPGVACSTCRSTRLDWHVSAGRGRVYSWTVVWRPPQASFDVPYAPAIVRIDEGYDMVSALVDVDHETIVADLAVEVVWHEMGVGVTLPYFRPRSRS